VIDFLYHLPDTGDNKAADFRSIFQDANRTRDKTKAKAEIIRTRTEGLALISRSEGRCIKATWYHFFDKAVEPNSYEMGGARWEEQDRDESWAALVRHWWRCLPHEVW
jgi:hypothetical protein